ncbi:MAG: AAA family ATPase [Frankiaceae bacterium]
MDVSTPAIADSADSVDSADFRAAAGALGSGTDVLSMRSADVGVMREQRRRRRLWRLSGWFGALAGYLWWAALTGHWPSMPHLDLLTLGPILFFAMLIGVLVAQWVVTGRSPHVVFRPEQIDVRLRDVVGIDPVKDEVIRSLNLFLAHKTFARDMGGRPRRGLLFEGGPGTGKTHTAKAMAAEAGVPFLYASASSFQSSFQGATSRKVRNFFRELRRLGEREGGAIGFIDEFDAMASSRQGMAMTAAPATAAASLAASAVAQCGGLVGLPAQYGASAALAPVPARSTTVTGFVGGNDLSLAVNELLVQLQSFDEPTGAQKLLGRLIDKVNLLLPDERRIKKPPVRPANIMLVASTNRADMLDPALMRPGRFDRRLTFEVPDRAGRRALVDHFLARKGHVAALDDPAQRDAIAMVTTGYTPAMLEGVFDEALINAVRRGSREMTRADIETARLTLEIGMGQPKAYTAYEERLIATHEAGHATVAYLVAPERRLEVLSIVKRRDALGMLAHGDADDVYTRSRDEMTRLIRIAMGGQVAEELFFDDVSTGPGGDLLYATNVAAQMVGACGMTDTLVSYVAIENAPFTDTNIVGRVLADGDGRARVERLLQEQKAAVRALLAQHRHLVAALRDALLAKRELIGREITDVLHAAEAAVGQPAPSPTVIDLRDAAAPRLL